MEQERDALKRTLEASEQNEKLALQQAQQSKMEVREFLFYSQIQQLREAKDMSNRNKNFVEKTLLDQLQNGKIQLEKALDNNKKMEKELGAIKMENEKLQVKFA